MWPPASRQACPVGWLDRNADTCLFGIDDLNIVGSVGIGEPTMFRPTCTALKARNHDGFVVDLGVLLVLRVLWYQLAFSALQLGE